MSEDVHPKDAALDAEQTELLNNSNDTTADVTNIEIEERLSKLEVELNYMHDENDRLKLDNQRQLSETKEYFENKIHEFERKLAETLHQYEKKCNAFKILEGNYKSKCEIIQNMENTQTTLQNLIRDKDEVIGSQNVVIESIQKDALDRESLKSTINQKDTELAKAKEELVLLQSTRESTDTNSVGIHHELEKEKEQKSDLQKNFQIEKAALDQRLDDLEKINNNREIELQTLKHTIKAKNDIILNLKICDKSHQKEDKDTMTSNLETDSKEDVTSLQEKMRSITAPGLLECIVCLESIALHGVIMNGLLVWANMERRTAAGDMWKAKAIEHFSPEEIKEAKDLLWEVCSENVLGKKVQRQGSSKQKSEVEDISKALNLLAEKQILPIFVTTSDTAMRNPIYTGTLEKANYLKIEKNLQELTGAFETFSKCQTDLLSKNHNRLMSKADVKIKKIEELKQALNKNNIVQMDPTSDIEENRMGIQYYSNPYVDHTIGNNWNSPTNVNLPSYIPGNMTAQLQNTSVEQPAPQIGTEENLAADIDLVVKGISKNVSEQQLSNFLHQRKLTIVDCKLLTKYAEARSLTFKITIKASDRTKSRNPSVWPDGVSVSLFTERKNIRTQGRRSPSRKPAYNNKNSNLNTRNQKQHRLEDESTWLRGPPSL